MSDRITRNDFEPSARRKFIIDGLGNTLQVRVDNPKSSACAYLSLECTHFQGISLDPEEARALAAALNQLADMHRGEGSE